MIGLSSGATNYIPSKQQQPKREKQQLEEEFEGVESKIKHAIRDIDEVREDNYRLNDDLTTAYKVSSSPASFAVIKVQF